MLPSPEDMLMPARHPSSSGMLGPFGGARMQMPTEAAPALGDAEVALRFCCSARLSALVAAGPGVDRGCSGQTH